MEVRPQVLLIPERMIADVDSEAVQAMRSRIRRSARQRETETREQAMAAPEYRWSATRRR